MKKRENEIVLRYLLQQFYLHESGFSLLFFSSPFMISRFSFSLQYSCWRSTSMLVLINPIFNQDQSSILNPQKKILRVNPNRNQSAHEISFLANHVLPMSVSQKTCGWDQSIMKTVVLYSVRTVCRLYLLYVNSFQKSSDPPSLIHGWHGYRIYRS
jgi:hypothetical protein